MNLHLSLRQKELAGRLRIDTIRLQLMMTLPPEPQTGFLSVPLTLGFESGQISQQL